MVQDRGVVGVDESETEQSDPIGRARLVTDVMPCRHRCYRHVVGVAERASGKSSSASATAFSDRTRHSMPGKKAKIEQPQNEVGPIDGDQPVPAKRIRRAGRGKKALKASGLLEMPLDAINEVCSLC